MNDSNLVNLIKSLKGNEKRYAVIYLSKHSETNNSLKLFKLISHDPSITDAEISENIKDKNIASRLHQNKYVLYNLLLDALHQFDLRTSSYGRVLTMLHQSEILLNKGLIQARMELLLKAEQMADKYALLELKLEIVRLQNVGILNQSFLKEKKILTDKIINHAQLRYLVSRATIFINKTGERLTLTQRKYLAKLLSAFKKKGLKQDSFYSKYIFLSFLMRYYMYSREFDKSYMSGMNVLKLFKQYPDVLRMPYWKFLYCNRLIELLGVSFRASKNKTAELVYHEILNLDISSAYKNGAHNNILDHYIQTGEFKKGSTYINDIQPHFVKDSFVGNNQMILFVNLAIINFGSGIYSKALFWLNEVLNSPKNKLANFPYIGIIRLIRLVTYYELKKFDLLEYEIHSTSTYIEKHGSSFTMDQLIMNYLLKMITINDKAELKTLMEEALSGLLKLTRIKSEAETLALFDFVSWFESKIENRSFEAVVKGKVKK